MKLTFLKAKFKFCTPHQIIRLLFDYHNAPCNEMGNVDQICLAPVMASFVFIKLTKSFIALEVFYVEACNELTRYISSLLHLQAFQEMSQRWRTVGNTASNSSGMRFERKTSSRSRDERVTAQPTNQGCPNFLWNVPHNQCQPELENSF